MRINVTAPITYAYHTIKNAVIWLKLRVSNVANSKKYLPLHENRGDKPASNYKAFKTLGQGFWGSVELVFSTLEYTPLKHLSPFYGLKRAHKNKAIDAHELAILEKMKGKAHVVQLVGELDENGGSCILMEDAGRDLTQLLKQNDTTGTYEKGKGLGILFKMLKKNTNTQILEEKLAAGLFSQALKGLKNMHQEGIVHNDIKPSNIFVNAKGLATIGDLGGARYLSAKSEFSGDRRYAPPEAGKVPHDFAGDIWMMGLTMAEVLLSKSVAINRVSRKKPKEIHKEIEQAVQRFQQSASKESTAESEKPILSPEAARVLLKMLAEDPAERPDIESLLEMDFFRHGMKLPIQ